MLRTLIAKDLRRTWRNPVPWIVWLVVPFTITGLIGAIFGPRGGGGGLGQIDVAFVDEDATGLTEFLKGALEQMRSSDAKEQPPFRLRAHFLARDEALRRLTENEIAAAVILPKGFTDALLGDDQATAIELVKNPARATQPRVVEEMLGLLVTALNAFKGLAGDELGQLRALVESDDDALTKAAAVGGLLVAARERLEPVKAYLAPPLIGYEEEKRANTAAAQRPGGSVFAFLLAGMSAMFLLYMCDGGMRDLYREAHLRTIERYRTLRDDLFVFVGGKALFAVATALIGAAILLGGGAVLFQFSWRQPHAVLALVVAYAFCGAGIMGFLAAVMGTERRADIMSNIVVMGLTVLGGCMFPPEILPPFVREYATPWMPTAWFAGAVRALQFEEPSGAWMIAAAKLAALAVVSLLAATMLFRRRLEQGVRA